MSSDLPTPVADVDNIFPSPVDPNELQAVIDRLLAARRIVLTTHVNADGDGAGSQVAVAAWLEARGAHVDIINPTPFPPEFRFLLHRPDLPIELDTPEAEAAFSAADLFVVLDTSEAKRIGRLRDRFREDRIVVVDHHPAADREIGDTVLRSTASAATGEIVHDIIESTDGPWEPSVVQGLYVALVTDTGSFRYSNTTPRTHMVAASLLQRGVDPEDMYRKLYANVPLRQLRLLREALGSVEVDEERSMSWMVVDNAMTKAAGATPDDYEGLIEHVRSLEGTEVAFLFRETPEGRTKISFRSNGTADVSRLARSFGGGGHVKAAGALLNASPSTAVRKVLGAAREMFGPTGS